MSAKKRRTQPQRRQHAPLGVLQHEYIRGLPAGKADFLHARFIHEAKDVPVRHGGNAIHGRAGCGKIVVQFAAHSGPDRPKTAAHHRQRRRAVSPLRRNPQAASFQPGKGFGIGNCWQSQQFLPPCGVDGTNAPLLASLLQVGITHAIKNYFVLEVA